MPPEFFGRILPFLLGCRNQSNLYKCPVDVGSKLVLPSIAGSKFDAATKRVAFGTFLAANHEYLKSPRMILRHSQNRLVRTSD